MYPTVKSAVQGICLCGLLAAQSYDVTLEKKTGYNGWTVTWDTVYAATNGIVAIAVVPKLGGRVMQYNLGTNASIYIHDSRQVPASGNDMVGGFRVLPSPQSDFGWPSPPNLDFNPYACTERSDGPDSVVIALESRVENSDDAKYQNHKGLQFKRLITLYKASTRVKVEMTMLNRGTQAMTHGIWDITQTACPTTNCWVYFQRNPSSTLGGGKGYVQYQEQTPNAEAATQWKPDAAESNIMGVQFLKKEGKIGADCRAGWICFVDRQSGYAYVKTFAYQEGATYPDSGASVQVYTCDETYNMLEVEVLGPLVTLSAGDSTKLIENWYAARSFGPVLAVNKAGLVTKKLSLQQTGDTILVSGTFGIFHPGTVKTQLCTPGGEVVGVLDSGAVVPTDSLRVNRKFAVAPGSPDGILRIAVYDAQGVFIGTLDSIATTLPVVGINNGASERSFSDPYVKRTVIFPSNGALHVVVPFGGIFTTEIFSIDGKRLASFTDEAPYRYYSDLSIAGKVLLVSVAGPGRAETRVVCMPR
ncbi:MAG: hypothetical protein JXA18_04130 [Chitinispirillaceae bacterium]|nr:hypothetical protein [Chitinispirillaceae bacterium]